VITRDIRTSDPYTACDVCGRTLLRGEKADVYLNGGARRSVCELCKERALHEGWVREGTVPAYEDGSGGSDRRRSLLSRLRGRRDSAASPRAPAGRTPADPTLTDPMPADPTPADELDDRSWSELPPAPPEDPERVRTAARGSGDAGRARRRRLQEPRQVRAVPASIEQKIVSAVELFNGSEHPRTVAGVARSLGAPTVSVAPSDTRSSLMRLVVSWELCWYRYEVDLSEAQPSVRVADQGYELDELTSEELTANAAADEHGSLWLA
jgi:hypothetical protein